MTSTNDSLMGASQKKSSWYQSPLTLLVLAIIIFTLAFILIITVRNTEYSAKDIKNMCSEVTNQLIVNIPENSKIAILNIQNISNDTAVKYEHSNLIVENLITNLVRTAANNYQVFERSQIDRAENEINFQDSDLFNKTTVQSFGDFVGADYVIYGNLIVALDEPVFNFRCIKVSTTQIVGVANVQLPINFLTKLFNNNFVVYALVSLAFLVLLTLLFTHIYKSRWWNRLLNYEENTYGVLLIIIIASIIITISFIIAYLP